MSTNGNNVTYPNYTTYEKYIKEILMISNFETNGKRKEKERRKITKDLQKCPYVLSDISFILFFLPNKTISTFRRIYWLTR